MEQRYDLVGVAGAQMIVDVEQGGGDQLHPQLLDLVHDLELQLVGIDQGVERLLAAQQLLRRQVDLVVELSGPDSRS